MIAPVKVQRILPAAPGSKKASPTRKGISCESQRRTWTAATQYLAVSAGQALIANKPATRVSYDGVIARAGVS